MLQRSSSIFSRVSALIVSLVLLALFAPVAFVNASTISNTGFEDGTFTGWDRGTQTGTLGSTITQNGSGVTIFTGSRTFTHGSNSAVGSSSSPYYAPAVASGSWTFSPSDGTNAVLLQPKNQQTFNQAASALNLSAGSVTEIKNMLTSQAQASGMGGGTPTDAAWITREVVLDAGTTYTMSWNYVGTDYVPFNDGSITSLVPVTVSGTPVVTVNNYAKQYALLGFTNPGTGDYSTNSYGATGWQTSTYQVSVSGTYKLGFVSFNLDDTGLSPALMVDSEVGSTQKCVSGTCTTFGGVAPNNETAPTVAPTTTSTSTTSTTSTTVAQTTTTSTTTSTSTTTTSSTTTSSTTSTTVYIAKTDTTTSTALAITTTSTLPTPVVQIVVPIEVPSVTNVPVQVVTEPILIVPTGTTQPPVAIQLPETTSPVVTIEPTPKIDTTLITETTLILLPVITDETIVKPTSPNTTVKITETTAVKITETTVATSSKVKTVTSDILDVNATPEEVDKALDKVLDSNFTDAQLTQVVDSVFSDITKTEQVTALVADFLEKDLSTKELTTVMEAVFSEDATVGQMSAVIDDLLGQDLSTNELTAVFSAAFDDDLSDKETIDLIVDVLKDGLDAETLGAALGAVFDKEVSTEVLIETFTAVLGNELNKESIGTIVGVLESDTITSEQVGQVVALVIKQEGGILSDQATELATSPKVLESIDGKQATEVFASIVVAEVSQEAGAEIAEALANAGTDVKESFEEEINVFAGVFDTYLALGSEINVGDRRTVIAVGAAVAIAGAVAALGGASPSSGGGAPSGGSGSPSGQNNNVARKPEEEEMNGELAWDGVEWINQLSIFRYNNGVKILDWGLFMKKFTFGVLNLGFTISGSLVVYLTLSGTIQRIAGISSILALMGAMYLHMREPDNN